MESKNIMLEKVIVRKHNEVYMKLDCEPSLMMEISTFFTFEVPGAKFSPAYKNRVWDGKIRLANQLTRLLYTGLLSHLEQFCSSREYELILDGDFGATEFSRIEAEAFIKKLAPKHYPRDYQIDAFVHAVRNRRSLLLSPTGSGKSLIIYLLACYYRTKTLVIVPTTSLVHQMASDFEDYGLPKGMVHKIMSGEEKDTDKPFVVSTWQSIYKLPKKWFQQFNLVIGDEAHLFKAKSLTSILSAMDTCKYRFGFTGTLDGTQTHKLVLEGLFGAVKKVTTTADLMEQKHLAELTIKALLLKYPEVTRKTMCKAEYQAEMDFLVRSEARNKFIKNLALSLKGNTLLLFQYVEKHGKVLHDMIAKDAIERKVFFISGEVDGNKREEIRHIIESETDAIIVASYGTSSTGINIKNLSNVVFASPSKSRIRNLQSIGRGLRTSHTKSTATLYDIADDLSWKSSKNHTLLHFVARIKIYNSEKFRYKVYNIDI
jgi:superfamily II DNA or RNA helicase